MTILSASDVLNKDFDPEDGGYNRDQVDAYLDQIVNTLTEHEARPTGAVTTDPAVAASTLLAAAAAMHDAHIAAANEEARKVLAAANEEADKVRVDAVEEAERILNEARQTAEEIVGGVEARRDELVAEIGELDAVASETKARLCRELTEALTALGGPKEDRVPDPAGEGVPSSVPGPLPESPSLPDSVPLVAPGEFPAIGGGFPAVEFPAGNEPTLRPGHGGGSATPTITMSPQGADGEGALAEPQEDGSTDT